MIGSTDPTADLAICLLVQNGGARSAALDRLRALPDEALLDLLASCTRPPTLSSRRLLGLLPTAALFAVFLAAVAAAFARRPDLILWFLAGFAALSVAALTASVLWALLSGTAGRRMRVGQPVRISGLITSVLVDRSDPRFLPFLLSALAADYDLFERSRDGLASLPPLRPHAGAGPGRMGDQYADGRGGVQRRRYRSLALAMLNQAHPDRIAALNADQRNALLLFLKRPEEEVEFTLAILRVLGCAGAEREARAVKRLAREKHWYVGSDRVEEEARICLKAIQQRLQERADGTALLRPVRLESAPISLLRPSPERLGAEPAQLLRPEGYAHPEE